MLFEYFRNVELISSIKHTHTTHIHNTRHTHTHTTQYTQHTQHTNNVSHDGVEVVFEFDYFVCFWSFLFRAFNLVRTCVFSLPPFSLPLHLLYAFWVLSQQHTPYTLHTLDMHMYSNTLTPTFHNTSHNIYLNNKTHTTQHNNKHFNLT